jgi:hypothetical protein
MESDTHIISVTVETGQAISVLVEYWLVGAAQ